MDLGHAVKIALSCPRLRGATSGMPSVSSAAKGAADVDRILRYGGTAREASRTPSLASDVEPRSSRGRVRERAD
jgi:hypothetical protein